MLRSTEHLKELLHKLYLFSVNTKKLLINLMSNLFSEKVIPIHLKYYTFIEFGSVNFEFCLLLAPMVIVKETDVLNSLVVVSKELLVSPVTSNSYSVSHYEKLSIRSLFLNTV